MISQGTGGCELFKLGGPILFVLVGVVGGVGGGGVVVCLLVGGWCLVECLGVQVTEHERGVCRGTWGYIYVLLCLYGFTLFALEVG